MEISSEMGKRHLELVNHVIKTLANLERLTLAAIKPVGDVTLFIDQVLKTATCNSYISGAMDIMKSEKIMDDMKGDKSNANSISEREEYLLKLRELLVPLVKSVDKAVQTSQIKNRFKQN